MAHHSPSLLDRRETIGALGASLALGPWAISAETKPAVDAIAFDAFPIFDPRSVEQQVIALVPERGRELAQAWSSKLFSTSWLYTAAGQYIRFDAIADNSLRYAAEGMGLLLSSSDRDNLVNAYRRLKAWPDVTPSLAKLREAGIKLALLSNLGEEWLGANLDRNELTASFDHVLSTDRVRAFKPSPKAYAMALRAFALPKSRIGFAAFGGWDAAGASWFGFPTAWVNRAGAPREEIAPESALISRDLSSVIALAGLRAVF
jgi:2-haloacid dehalogenase